MSSLSPSYVVVAVIAALAVFFAVAGYITKAHSADQANKRASGAAKDLQLVQEQLKSTRAQLDERARALTPDQLSNLLEDIGCPPLIRELVGLRLCHSSEDKIKSLSRIPGELPSASTLSDCLHHNLKAILRALRLPPSDADMALLVKILECYGYLIPLLNASSRMQVFEDTRALIDEPVARAEAVRSVLVPLLKSDISNADFLNLYEQVLQSDPTDHNDRAAIRVALANIDELELNSFQSIRFLLASFGALAASWNAFRELYMQQLRTISRRKLDKTDLTLLLTRINSHIDRDGLAILAPEREQEYWDIATMISLIHTSQNVYHPLRPRIRHVVPSTKRIPAKVTLNGLAIPGVVENFAIGEQYKVTDRVGCGGAWFVANEKFPENLAEGWRPAAITIIHASLDDPLEIPCHVSRESDKKYNRDGFRVKWPSVTDQVVSKLKILAREYPIKR